MKRTLFILLVIAALAAAAWYGAMWREERRDGAATAQLDDTDYDFEAEGVLMRQMDAAGKLEFELEAERILQFPDGGRVVASNLTLRHEPRGGSGGWTLTAREGHLPASERVVTLSGSVTAIGTPSGWSTPLRMTTDSLSYDMPGEQLYTDAQVEFTRGCTRLRGSSLRLNVATGDLALESGNGTLCR